MYSRPTVYITWGPAQTSSIALAFGNTNIFCTGYTTFIRITQVSAHVTTSVRHGYGETVVPLCAPSVERYDAMRFRSSQGHREPKAPSAIAPACAETQQQNMIICTQLSHWSTELHVAKTIQCDQLSCNLETKQMCASTALPRALTS